MIHKHKRENRWQPDFTSNESKPLEIYMFIDPLCPDCWALEPVMKKLQIQYGHYFTLKYVLSGRLKSLNSQKLAQNERKSAIENVHGPSKESCNEISGSLQNPISSPFIASIAIKAAELQGRRAGIKFLRKLQEQLFIKKQNITDYSVVVQCAEQVGLDIEEFINDLYSKSAQKAFQCDLKITNEMNVSEYPTIVFFNNNVEEDGIKVTGYHSYHVYTGIMQEMVSETLVPKGLPDLLDFISYYQMVTSKDIAFVYDWPMQTVETEMKKLVLKQEVEQIKTNNGIIWKKTEN